MNSKPFLLKNVIFSSEYSQVSEVPLPAAVEPKKSRVPGESIFEGDDLDLVDHIDMDQDVDRDNMMFLARTEELWDTLNNSLWWTPLELLVEDGNETESSMDIMDKKKS